MNFFIFFYSECLKYPETANCTKMNGTVISDGTCVTRKCNVIISANQSFDVISIGMNPANLIEKEGYIECNISDFVWKNYTLQNSRMPSDEYFQ